MVLFDISKSRARELRKNTLNKQIPYPGLFFEVLFSGGTRNYFFAIHQVVAELYFDHTC